MPLWMETIATPADPTSKRGAAVFLDSTANLAVSDRGVQPVEFIVAVLDGRVRISVNRLQKSEASDPNQADCCHQARIVPIRATKNLLRSL